MKIHKSIGSKERLFEMMGKVNKVKLNEYADYYNPATVLESAFDDLKNGVIKPEKSKVEIVNDESFITLLCFDKQGNNITFTFKATATEGDQEGVFDMNQAIMTEFAFDFADGNESIELDENGLKQFNAQHRDELFDVVSEYADFETAQPEEIDELYEEAVKKIDSYPFGGTPERMQTSKAYGDEKPTNPVVRVKAPELEKFEFVDEAITVKPDVYNSGQKYFDQLNPMTKKIAIEMAKQFVDQQLAAQGLQHFDVPQDVYRNEIKRLATARYEQHLSMMNEEAEKEKGEYPDPIGKKFKPKNQMPKKKKKPQSVVKLSEEYEEDDYLEIPDLEIPADKRAMRAAKSDMAQDTVVDKEPDANSEDDYDFVFNEGESMNRSEGENLIRKYIGSLSRRMDFGKLVSAYEELLKMRGELRTTSEYQSVLSSLRDAIAKYFNINNLQVSSEDVQNYFYSHLPHLKEGEEKADDGMSLEPKGDELEKIAQDKEQVGDELEGGKADGKSPLEYDPDQILKGIKVELEHTDDPMKAVEIAMDHLEELPDYYDRLEKMEKEAGAGHEEGESDDEELTDVLLGYEPKNVGDEVNEEEDVFGRMGDIFRPETSNKGGNKTKMFKIGEYAVGGIIKVDIDMKSGVQGGEIAISALDYNTKQPVQGSRFVATNFNSIDNYLNELTSSYYAGKIMEWIKANLGVSSKPNYFSNQTY